MSGLHDISFSLEFHFSGSMDALTLLTQIEISLNMMIRDAPMWEFWGDADF